MACASIEDSDKTEQMHMHVLSLSRVLTGRILKCSFDLCLFGFVGFLFLLVSGKGSLDFSLTFFFMWTRKTDKTARMRLIRKYQEKPQSRNSKTLGA